MRYRYIFLFVLVVGLLWLAERYVDDAFPAAQGPPKEGWSKYRDFSDEFLPASTRGMLIRHAFYTLSYREDHEQAEWVAYELQPAHLRSRSFDRPYFELDPKVATRSADWRNYRNSGYDRGHLCPAGDRAFNLKAYNETFLTSNISPQIPAFNGGVWNRLEQKVRYWADRSDGLFVVTGGVLQQGLQEIGRERVSVPDQFYKILLDKKGDTYRAVAFLLPHEPSDRPLYEFVVSVDHIERLTGLDFFRAMPDHLEEAMERESKSTWLDF